MALLMTTNLTADYYQADLCDHAESFTFIGTIGSLASYYWHPCLPILNLKLQTWENLLDLWQNIFFMVSVRLLHPD